ncbi:hypothetical protein NDU88_004540 [Pleurodeles waltl]|uniref:Uncharacterized protein n=1 Tax=Pleurodeles waltl TaxID=8319 RepID=A0AAV7QCX6_PLEWA|nr:hypothetical protein NDU88_004540 [Pleurodeles waltl]
MHGDAPIFRNTLEEAWVSLEQRGITIAPAGALEREPGGLRQRGRGPRHRTLWAGPSKEQAAEERALVIAEVEHRVTSPPPSLSDQEHMDDNNLGADRVLADAPGSTDSDEVV